MDIEVFLNSFEAELTVAGVKEEWKHVLISKLILKAKGTVLDLLEIPSTTYDNLKQRLFNRIGISRVQPGIKIWGCWMNEAHGKSGR